MRIVRDIEYDATNGCRLDAYLPDENQFPTIVYFHGGGLEVGDKADENYLGIAESFTKKGYGFLSVNYRMYPTAKFPEYLEDGAAAIAWTKAHIQEDGGNGVLYVSGQSAGAWMSMMLCLNEKYLQAVAMSPLEIQGWIIDSAQTTAHFNVLKYEEGCDPNLQRINEYAPLYYVNSQTKFNRMLILFYDNDMPCRAEQNMLFIKAVENFCHGVDLEYKQLKGAHCHGSSERDSDGEYQYVKEVLRWLK